jgi:sucrose-6F-phosphate phosphohydrolase
MKTSPAETATNDKRWLFVADVDDTLLGDDASLEELMACLAAAEQVTAVYNSSRPCASLRETLAQNPRLRPPHYLIGALGTEIEDGATGAPLTNYQAHLRPGWQRPAIHALLQAMGFTPHPDKFQTPFKASYDVPDEAAYRAARERLATAVLPAKLIFSGGKNLDIIPVTAGKGRVIQFLQRWLGIPGERVVVAGDSGNDVDMFIPPFRGIIVGNADPDLRALAGPTVYQAQAPYAAGVLEGLRYWGVLPATVRGSSGIQRVDGK